MTDMTVRIERVRAFLDYLETRESAEILVAAGNGPFQEALVPGLKSQIEHEIALISKKLPGADVYGPA